MLRHVLIERRCIWNFCGMHGHPVLKKRSLDGEVLLVRREHCDLIFASTGTSTKTTSLEDKHGFPAQGDGEKEGRSRRRDEKKTMVQL